jgi:predicted transcriptional regulator
MENLTMSFVTTQEQKACLEAMANEEERSISFVLRKIIDDYMTRREYTQRLAQAVRQVKPVPDGNVTPGDGWGYPVANEG